MLGIVESKSKTNTEDRALAALNSLSRNIVLSSRLRTLNNTFSKFYRFSSSAELFKYMYYFGEATTKYLLTNNINCKLQDILLSLSYENTSLNANSNVHDIKDINNISMVKFKDLGHIIGVTLKEFDNLKYYKKIINQQKAFIGYCDALEHDLAPKRPFFDNPLTVNINIDNNSTIGALLGNTIKESWNSLSYKYKSILSLFALSNIIPTHNLLSKEALLYKKRGVSSTNNYLFNGQHVKELPISKKSYSYFRSEIYKLPYFYKENSIPKNYSHFMLSKKNYNSYRLVSAPNKKLKNIQRLINEKFQTYPFSKEILAYKKNSDFITYFQKNKLKYKYVYTADIKNYFPSIRNKNVIKGLAQFIYTDNMLYPVVNRNPTEYSTLIDCRQNINFIKRLLVKQCDHYQNKIHECNIDVIQKDLNLMIDDKFIDTYQTELNNIFGKDIYTVTDDDISAIRLDLLKVKIFEKHIYEKYKEMFHSLFEYMAFYKNLELFNSTLRYYIYLDSLLLNIKYKLEENNQKDLFDLSRYLRQIKSETDIMANFLNLENVITNIFSVHKDLELYNRQKTFSESKLYCYNSNLMKLFKENKSMLQSMTTHPMKSIGNFKTAMHMYGIEFEKLYNLLVTTIPEIGNSQKVFKENKQTPETLKELFNCEDITGEESINSIARKKHCMPNYIKLFNMSDNKRYNQALPQGAPTSGTIANFLNKAILRDIKNELHNYQLKDYEILIYSDNIYFFHNAHNQYDSNDEYIPSKVLHKVLVDNYGLKLNTKKCTLFEGKDKKILGILMDDDGYIRTSRKYMDEINQIIIALNKKSEIVYKGTKYNRKDVNCLLGKMGWFKHANFGTTYSRKLIKPNWLEIENETLY